MCCIAYRRYMRRRAGGKRGQDGSPFRGGFRFRYMFQCLCLQYTAWDNNRLRHRRKPQDGSMRSQRMPQVREQEASPRTSQTGAGVQSHKAQEYVLNINSMKFHLPDCPSVKAMKEENKEVFKGMRDYLISEGFEPCGNCNP